MTAPDIEQFPAWLRRRPRYLAAWLQWRNRAGARWTTVGIGPRSEGDFGLEVTLEVRLAGLSPTQAATLAHKALEVCPYSNATRNNIAVQPRVV